VRDEQTGAQLKIAAWWIPAEHPAPRTVVIVHGYGDAKVGGIAWAPLFHDLGWNVLAIDLRAHGESDGKYTTAGYWERHDLNQVLNQFRAQSPRETQELVIFAVSLGAAATLAAVRDRDDILGLILEGPFTSYRDAVAAHGQLFGAPGGLLQRAAIALAQRIAQADFDAVKPVDLIPHAPCPIMIVHACDDCFTSGGEPQAFRAALARHQNPRDVLWEIAQAGHVLGLAKDTQEYRERVKRFLESIAVAEPRSPRTPPAPAALPTPAPAPPRT